MRKLTLLITGLFSLCTVFFGASAFASAQKNITGVLQAYWFPQWNDEGKAKPPLIMMRFFETDGKDNHTYFLYDMKEKGEVKDYFNVKQMEKFIKSNFKNTPEEFFKFKEGHTEQPGRLIFSDEMVISECDSKKIYAKFNDFKPDSAGRYDVKELELKSGCDPEPYMVMFTIKDGIKNIYLKSKPDEKSANVSDEPVSQPLVKIKTIDNEWVYVSLYDASQSDSQSKMKGYLNIKDLDVVN